MQDAGGRGKPRINCAGVNHDVPTAPGFAGGSFPLTPHPASRILSPEATTCP